MTVHHMPTLTPVLADDEQIAPSYGDTVICGSSLP
jgi:hypothetical protein